MKDPAIAWVEAARGGDEDAASHLVNAFHARIFAFLRRLTGSESDATELTQRAYCRAWSSLAGFQGRASVSSWLHGIAYRTYVDWLRSDRRFETRTDEWWENLPDSEATPDTVAARGDTASAVYAAVERLDRGLRETIHVHYYQGLTIEETAEALGIATGTVKFRVRDAIARIRRLLSPDTVSVPPFPQVAPVTRRAPKNTGARDRDASAPPKPIRPS